MNRSIILPIQLMLTAVLVVGGQSALAQTALPDAPVDADYAPVDRGEARLGQLLFYDPILSGNREVSCATCHHPRFGTSDGLSLGLGDGGTGLGPDRRASADNRPEARVPRNSPALFNLGAAEFTVLFHDGRIEADADSPTGLRTPLGRDMEQGFASVLSAQTMFPVLSDDEMAGHLGENDVSRAARQGRITGPGGAWDILARRVSAIPAYGERFARIYPHIDSPEQIHFTDISNAIASFIAFEWRSDDSAFDRWRRGEGVLTPAASRGTDLFYGQAGCAACHSGPFQTDHRFYAMGSPQLGPGKASSFEDHARDTGRMRVTGRDADAYAFRTPSLRNVTRTAPYGHAGGHRTLEAFLRFHLDPRAELADYTRDVVLPEFEAEDWREMDAPGSRNAIAAAVTTPPVILEDDDIADLLAFLEALDDPVALAGRLGVPDGVPSGLPVEK